MLLKKLELNFTVLCLLRKTIQRVFLLLVINRKQLFSYRLKKYGFEILTDYKSNYLNVYDMYEK